MSCAPWRVVAMPVGRVKLDMAPPGLANRRTRLRTGTGMPQSVEQLLAILDIETIELNLFRGHSPAGREARVFGGQVVGQSLIAAGRTVDGALPHSLHAYFLLGGDPKAPILYEVDRLRDGRSFTTRRVTAIQHGQAIYSTIASFHRDEAGFDHAIAMPEAPDPESLPNQAAIAAGANPGWPDSVRAFYGRERALDLRIVDAARFDGERPSASTPFRVWMRVRGRLPDDPALHRAVLAYGSDHMLLDTSLAVHGTTLLSSEIQAASLDHAIWFHRSVRADDWLLYVQDSPNAGFARGFTRGLIFDRAGRLVASTAQEGLIRSRSAGRETASGGAAP